MASGSREYDFNEMAKLGGEISQNQKALDDVRSTFVGPMQESADDSAPVPTEVDLGDDAPMPTEVNLDSVNEKELAYAAKRRMEEEGHPGADMLMTPNNLKKLAQFETKARRVEAQRQAYEQDPQKYEMDTADALDGYTKSWMQKYQLDHQGEGAARGINTAVQEVGQAEAPSTPKEVQGMDSPRGQGPRSMSGASSGGEAPTPRRQQSGGTERRPDPSEVPASDTKPKSVTESSKSSGITTGPVNPNKPDSPATVERKQRAAAVKDYRMQHGGMTAANAEIMPTFTYENSTPEQKAVVDAAQDTPWGIEANLPKHVRTGGGAAGSILARELGGAASKGMTKGSQRVGSAVETAKAAISSKLPKPAAVEVNNNISRVSKPPGLAVRDMISEQRSAQAKSGYTAPGEKGYKPPSQAELSEVRSENKARVAAKKAANPNIKSKTSQRKEAKKKG